MQEIKQAASECLASKRVAVTGVSTQPKNHGSNIVYRRLRERGFEVFAINPKADEVEGDPCHQDLRWWPKRSPTPRSRAAWLAVREALAHMTR
jgi:uncharacterized protein